MVTVHLYVQVRTVCKEPVPFMKMLTAAVTSDGEVTDGGSHRILHRYGEEEIGVKLSLRKVGCSSGVICAAPVMLAAPDVACVYMWQ